MILALLAMVVTLILVIGIHELGHAISAKFFGVKIQRIAIGFGRSLFAWKDKSGREWAWALWPLGGSVQLLNSRIQPVPAAQFNVCFDKKPIWQRCIILLSGALANLLVAWLALTIMYMVGYKQQTPVIEKIIPQTIAAKAGFQAGDSFVSMGDQLTNSWQEVGMGFIRLLGKPDVPILVKDKSRHVRQIKLDLSQWRYKKGMPSLLTSLGIDAAPIKENTKQIAGQSVVSAFSHAVKKSFYLIGFFLIMLKQIITGTIPFAVLLGPLGLFASSIHSFFQGISVFMYFIATLSLAVGLVNLMPVPGLDGGLILYALVEKVRGKPVSIAFEVLLHRLVMIIFMLIFVQLLINDLQRYIR